MAAPPGKYLVVDASRVTRSLTAALANVGPMKQALLSRLAAEMLEAETPVTPLGPRDPEPGRLRAGLYAEVTDESDGVATGVRGVPYAAAVHEGVHPPKRADRGDVIHYSTPGTGAKFIENPVLHLCETRLLRKFVDEFLPDVFRKK